MKKIICALLVLLMACGCSSSNASSSDAKISADKEEVYFKYDGKTYTNNDAFQKLKAQQVSNYFELVLAMKAAEIENISLDEKKQQLKDQYQSIVEQYGEDVATSYFGMDADEYAEKGIVSSGLIYTAYLEKYVADNMDSLISQNPTYYVEYISSKTEAKMKTFLKNVKKSDDFEAAAEKTKFEESETPIKNIIEPTDTTLPTEVMSQFSTLEAGALSDIIEIDNDDETKTYYVVRLISKDAKADYSDEFTSFLISKDKLDSITSIVEGKHEIIFYDDDFNNAYKNITSSEAY